MSDITGQKLATEIEASGAIDPAHYKQHKIEPIDVIEAWGLTFCLGSVLKYLAKANYSGTKRKDLIKAANYCYREATGLWLPKELQYVEKTEESQTDNPRVEVSEEEIMAYKKRLRELEKSILL